MISIEDQSEEYLWLPFRRLGVLITANLEWCIVEDSQDHTDGTFEPIVLVEGKACAITPPNLTKGLHKVYCKYTLGDEVVYKLMGMVEVK